MITTRPTVVYLAGPMTGYKDHNIPAFVDGAERLRHAGYQVRSPAEWHPSDKAPFIGWTWEQFLRADLRLMLSTDIIVLLPGWTGSRGAKLEERTGAEVGIPGYSLNYALTYARDLAVRPL